jgi:site-specific DNA-methyltransferase (adenine-specific)
LIRVAFNSYAAPTVRNKIHPSQKPEPMLRHFFSMLVDETTTMLDPTCGSAASLRAAEDLGARSILGVELDPNYAATALQRTLQARVLRALGKTNREDLL